jgi:hypothetical protein
MPRRTHKTADLRAMAWYQRVLIVCLVVQLLIWAGYIVAVTSRLARDNGEGATLGLLWTAAVGLVGGVFVFLLGRKVYGPVAGVILGLLTVTPCVGLVVILVVNASATSALQSNGVRVGLLGARMRDIAELSDDGLEDTGDEEVRPRRRRRRDEINEEEGW